MGYIHQDFPENMHLEGNKDSRLVHLIAAIKNLKTRKKDFWF